MNGFKTMFSAKLVSLISNWLDDKFVVVYRADALHLIRKFSDPKKSVYVEKILNEAAANFGISPNALGYMVEGDSKEARLCSVFKGSEKGAAIPAELFESYGTIRFVNIFPLVVMKLNSLCATMIRIVAAIICSLILAPLNRACGENFGTSISINLRTISNVSLKS